MFCYQCSQTKGGKGCDAVGVCGKTPETAALQDLLLFTLKGLAAADNRSRREGVKHSKVGPFTLSALFSTLTNVNFDSERLVKLIHEATELRNEIRRSSGGDFSPALDYQPPKDAPSLVRDGESHGIEDGTDPLTLSLRETTIYGLKGLAAYVHHAARLGREDDSLYAFVSALLEKSLDPNLKAADWLDLALETGKFNYLALELLDKANRDAFGVPGPAPARLRRVKGPAILVSGHDLKDLLDLLEQTKGTDVKVYTHSEMLPAHGYPKLRAFPHLAGHFGTAWQNQAGELKNFPGPVLFTTNCLKKPAAEKFPHTFVTGPAAWPSVNRIEEDASGFKDFSPLIRLARELGGFARDEDEGSVLTGFGHQAVLGLAGKIVEAVKTGAVKGFLLVGGCDGPEKERDYYRELVNLAPRDVVILTLACGKFRFSDLDLGDAGGIPRYVDLGQCNDAYSAIQIALALAEAFKTDVNSLPLRLTLSWFEQKAVAILLTLLHLGVKNIRLGPNLPAFLHPEALKTLNEKFNLAPISTAGEDLLNLFAV
ncbi:MAG: hydroxylamine reductase [Deltaproteobacteria bacterium]|nr:hydroxylamine reductase [Deltaproteobacteria bacterium]